VGALIGRTPFAYASRLGATAPSPVDLAIQDLAIVSLEREHVPALLVLGGEVFPYERESFAGSIDRYLEDCDGRATAPDRSAFWVLAASDGLAGFVGIYELPELPEEAWLGWFGVSAAHRHKGWGRRLLRFAIGAARARGFHTLRLWTTDEPDCAASAKLYDREGFDCVEVGASPRGDRLLVRTLGLTGARPIPWEALEPKPRNLGAVTLR
jgi:GNAT superfamily N-acetyltransferase